MVDRRPSPVRLSGQVVNSCKLDDLPIFRGGGVSCVSRGAFIEKAGGQSTPRCGGGAAGRRPTEKKTQTRMFAFFSTARPPATAGDCPSPFEPLMKGLRPEWSEAEWREQTPPIFAFERGKPGGEGEGQYRPPPHHHRSTRGLKVARPWAGRLGLRPHGACIAGKGCDMPE
jgi:hypothetical protein